MSAIWFMAGIIWGALILSGTIALPATAALLAAKGNLAVRLGTVFGFAGMTALLGAVLFWSKR